jgi:hypothetical protein
LSYRGRSKGNYDNRRRRSSSRGRSKSKRLQSDTKTARRNFEKRSTRSQVQDLIRMAPLAPNLEVYLKAPNRYDYPNVDTPDPKLIFSHKTHRQQAADLAKLATKAPVEIWVRNTARHDIQNVDTPGSKRAVIPEKTHKFKVTPKSKAKEETEKKTEKKKLAKAEKPKKEKPRHKLPTKKEILEKATELSMIDQLRQGIEPVTPEEPELKESGLFEEARRELMTGEGTKADSMVLQYIDSLKAEIEPMGFTIMPISET